MSIPAIGSRILNCKGVPGTLGCFAYKLGDGQPVLLSNWHVLYGQTARSRDPLWLVAGNGGRQTLRRIGSCGRGRIGIISYGQTKVYVDCAIGVCVGPVDGKRAVAKMADGKAGQRVYKYGAATGLTQGHIVTISGQDPAWIEGRHSPTVGQLVLRGDEGKPFSAAGDSGAVIFNEGGDLVGLLWGTTATGEGVACPIAPVAHVLHIGFYK